MRLGGIVVGVFLLLFFVLAIRGGVNIGLDKLKSTFFYNFERLVEVARLDPSTQHHLVTGQAGLKMFARSPFIGVGIGNYGEYYGRYFVKGKVREASHSSYVQFFAETGTLGGLALGWVLAAFLLALYDRYRELKRTAEPSSPLILAILAGSAGYFVANIFYFYITHEYIWLYLGLGIAATAVFSEKKDHIFA